MRPFIEGLIEPGESGIPLTEACVDQGNAVRRYKLPSCQSFEFDQCVLSFIDATSDSRDESPCGNRDRPFGELLFNVLKFGECVVVFPVPGRFDPTIGAPAESPCSAPVRISITSL
jgi:hypothetical protein